MHSVKTPPPPSLVFLAQEISICFDLSRESFEYLIRAHFAVAIDPEEKERPFLGWEFNQQKNENTARTQASPLILKQHRLGITFLPLSLSIEGQ